MKLESFKDKKPTRRKMILLSLGIIILVGVSLLLYKTFSSFSSEVSFRVMNGKVNYYGDSDVLFGYYNGETKLDGMPQKENPEKLVYDHGTCDNGATIEWDEEKWAPLVKNLTTTKTRCTLYFAEKKGIDLDKDIPLAKEGEDGLYAVEHNNLSELGSEWNKTEYRYAGKNPDNYVEFNGEKWRIIGLVNVKTTSGVEQRIKIIRTDGVESQKSFGNYAWDRYSNDTNNWTTSKLKDMLNEIYFNSGKGTCYTGSSESTASQSTCDFSGSGSLPKGLDEEARKMLDSEVIWNIGGTNSYNDVTVGMFYEGERGTSTYSTYPAEWTKANDGTSHNGLGLMYASDYGYATHGGSTGRTSCFAKELYRWDGNNYKTDCANNDWLKPSSGYIWTISSYSWNSRIAFLVGSAGVVGSQYYVDRAGGIWPTGYLTPSTTIYDGDGSIGNPFKLSVQ